MTLEERVEFLHQSIESHDRQIGELVESQAKTDIKLKELATRMDQGSERMELGFERMERGFERMERGFERAQANFDRLTAAMAGLTQHVSDHAHRIENLEQQRGSE